MNNKPIILSRECIRDTYLAKRQAREKLCGLVEEVYRHNMRVLRDGQLKPHVETRMLSNRFLVRQFCKRHPADVVIYIRDGLVEEVRSTDPYLEVTVVDYDVTDENRPNDIMSGDVEGNGDMHVVY